MKRHLIAATVLAAGFVSAQAADTPPAFKDEKDKISYAIGVNIGQNLKRQGADINADVLASAVKHILAGAKTKLTEQEVGEVLMAYSNEMRNKGRKEGEVWLAANAKKEGVKSYPSGLQYKVLISGKGPQPKPTDTVSAHYRGTLTDGTEFDSSYSRGTPFVTDVTRVIPGWTEALTNMHVGDKWQLYVPSQLAYGERGAPPKIKPNSVLIFEMELLGIEPPGTVPPGTIGAPQPARINPAVKPVGINPAVKPVGINPAVKPVAPPPPK